VTKFAAHVTQIILCEISKFDEQIYYSNWDNEFFLGDCFLLAHPVGQFWLSRSTIFIFYPTLTQTTQPIFTIFHTMYSN